MSWTEFKVSLLQILASFNFKLHYFPSTMGNSRKYQYTTTDGFNILTPLAFGNSKMHYLPCPQNSIIIKPPSPSEFPFFCQILWYNQMSSQIYPTGVILRQLVSHHPTFVIEGVVLIDSRNSGEKNWKINDFCLPLCNSYNLQKFYIAANCYRTL